MRVEAPSGIEPLYDHEQVKSGTRPGHRRFAPAPAAPDRDAYNRAVLSGAWTKRATEIRQARGGLCELCGRVPTGNEPTLQVHHLTYDRLGHEADHDLIVLCEPCHTASHVEARRIAREAQQEDDWR